MGAVILETKRLILRPWQEGDARRLYELCRDPEIGPAAGWPAHRSVEESLEIIRNVLDPDRTWAVTLRGNGLPIGTVGLKDTAAVEGGEPELGYWVGNHPAGGGVAGPASL
jgi:RimJ/RimL family protein N-acetyltransferase